MQTYLWEEREQDPGYRPFPGIGGRALGEHPPKYGQVNVCCFYAFAIQFLMSGEFVICGKSCRK
jgi:hypothetical protein